MELNVDFDAIDFMIHDLRPYPEKDEFYNTAVELARQIMTGIGQLERSGTVEVATLYIIDTGAQLNILTCSFENIPLDKMFESSLKRSSYEEDTGYIHAAERRCQFELNRQWMFSSSCAEPVLNR